MVYILVQDTCCVHLQLTASGEYAIKQYDATGIYSLERNLFVNSACVYRNNNERGEFLFRSDNMWQVCNMHTLKSIFQRCLIQVAILNYH